MQSDKQKNRCLSETGKVDSGLENAFCAGGNVVFGWVLLKGAGEMVSRAKGGAADIIEAKKLFIGTIRLGSRCVKALETFCL